jgi:protein phosphatase PTC2/3
MIVRDPEFP